MNSISRQPGPLQNPSRVAPAPARASAEAPQDMDVIVLKPDTDLMKSVVPTGAIGEEVARDLTSQGASVEGAFSLLPGASAKINPSTISSLKNEGYLVFDNRPRRLLPSAPHRRPRPEPGGGDDKPAPHRPDNIPPTPLVMPKVDVPSLVRSDKVNQLGFTGKNVGIAIIDSGYNHPQRPVAGWKDEVDGSPQANIDPVGHGDHCASDSVTCAPDASIIPIRVMNEKGEGRPSDIVRGIQWAIAHKEQYNIRVMNLSLGGPNDGVPSSRDPIDRAVEAAWKAGIVVVTAAGNDGPDAKTVGAPGDDPKAITVGSALDPKTVSSFSSVGPGFDGTKKPDITAPGEYIVGWAVPGSEMNDTAEMMEKLRHMSDAQLMTVMQKNPDFAKALDLPKNLMSMPATQRDDLVKSRLEPQYKPTPDTVAAPGTSFASPEVAGIAACLIQARPDATPDQIKQALLSTAHDMGSQWSVNQQGHGFVDAYAALQYLQKSA